MQNDRALVSVVIPVYNVEKYLRKCIDSVVSQTYKNIEIILVDDGSPDKCPQICDEYAEKYDNITVIHKTNGGLSDARNVGIERAKGKYILFLDSDDSLEITAIEDMVVIASKQNADAVIPYRYNKVFEDGTVKEAQHFKPEMFTDDPIAFSLDMLIGKGRARRATAVLYNNLLIKEKEIRFPIGRVSEDFFFNLDYLSKAGKIALYEKPSLNNLKRVGSISHSFYSDFFNTILEIDDKVAEFCKSVDDRYLDLSLGKRESLLYRNVLIFIIQVMVFGGKSYKENKKQAIEYLTNDRVKDALRTGVDLPYFEGKLQKIYFKVSLWFLKRKMYGMVCLLAYIAGKKNEL